MEPNPLQERDTVIIDIIESCIINTSKGNEETVEDKAKDRNLVISVLDVSSESCKNKTKNHSASSKHKKPPKPPRPPRGLSLEPADQKLIKELAELAVIKRARLERMKALKKMKAATAKASSSSNFVAILFTVAFCVLFILQGCHSSVRHRSAVSSSAEPNGLNPVPDRWTLSTYGVPLTSIESPAVMKLVPGSDGGSERREASSSFQ